MLKCPKCKEPLVTQQDLKDLQVEAATRLRKLAKTMVEGAAKIMVEGTCGCVFCDLDLEPTPIEGKEYHVTRHGVVRCSKLPR